MLTEAEKLAKAADPLARIAGQWDDLRSGNPGSPDSTQVSVTLGELRALEAALRALTLADQRRGGGDGPEIIRHRKGGEYEVLARGAQIQTDTPLTDYAKVDVYRSLKDGATWVRPVDEMHDGRFQVVGAPVVHPLPDQGGK